MSEQVDRIRRVVAVLARERVRYALVGGHAVSYHHRPRVTVDIDFLVSGRSTAKLARGLAREGFVTRKNRDVLRAWDRGMNPDRDESVVDFVPAELQATQREALRTAIEASYQGLHLRVVTRAALVALKFLSAFSPHRAPLDRGQDLVDLGRLVRDSWTPAHAREARRLVELGRAGAGAELNKLVDDIRNDRPIGI